MCHTAHFINPSVSSKAMSHQNIEINISGQMVLKFRVVANENMLFLQNPKKLNALDVN